MRYRDSVCPGVRKCSFFVIITKFDDIVNTLNVNVYIILISSHQIIARSEWHILSFHKIKMSSRNKDKLINYTAIKNTNYKDTTKQFNKSRVHIWKSLFANFSKLIE